MQQAERDSASNMRWQDELPDGVAVRDDPSGSFCEIRCSTGDLRDVCGRLVDEWGHMFAGLIVEDGSETFTLRYIFYAPRPSGWVHVTLRQTGHQIAIPSVGVRVIAADWHEREAEDLFGIAFKGHPGLGDFVLHNDRWQENVAPMRRKVDISRLAADAEREAGWKPRRIVEAQGVFGMPIGPIYSGVTECAQFLLETVGEDVIRTIVRLFFKYRAVEKVAEGRSAADALLIAERFAATTAFAHGAAFCQAVEAVCSTTIPPRALALRALFLELERFRHHVGAIREICDSTALVVATNQAAILEEDLLRLCCEVAGHRYLFGLVEPGGLGIDVDDGACSEVVRKVGSILEKLDELEEMLRSSSSFLDRLEQVGTVRQAQAALYGLAGPVARASGIGADLRIIQPYGGYANYRFEQPVEQEGDGYARLRVLFAEARQSLRIMEQAARGLPSGPIRTQIDMKPGAALGWVEAPRGAAFHWVRLNSEGKIDRYRIVPPSFANWHGFHIAAENFAFQDFPIILATFDLSVAENDR